MLGTVGDNPLVCFGINPSVAVPNALDPTVCRIKSLASRFGYDSCTMLNVYPQIATLPKDIGRALDQDLKVENEERIEQLTAGRPLTLLGAWGGLIKLPPYLPSLLGGIVSVTDAAQCTWVSYGDTIQGGHPQHLSRAKNGLSLDPFDLQRTSRGSCEGGARNTSRHLGELRLTIRIWCGGDDSHMGGEMVWLARVGGADHVQEGPGFMLR